MTKAAEHLAKNDAILGQLIAGTKIKRSRPERDHFRSLAEAILSQQISTKAADSIIRRFCGLFPRKIFPSPEQVARISLGRLRQAGVSRQKAGYLKDLARHVTKDLISFAAIQKLPDEEVIAKLVMVKGIGRWTAEMFLMFSLDRADVFSLGDLGLQNAIKNVYNLKTHPDKKKMEKISNAWKPYRTLAARYLWASLRKEGDTMV